MVFARKMTRTISDDNRLASYKGLGTRCNVLGTKYNVQLYVGNYVHIGHIDILHILYRPTVTSTVLEYIHTRATRRCKGVTLIVYVSMAFSLSIYICICTYIFIHTHKNMLFYIRGITYPLIRGLDYITLCTIAMSFCIIAILSAM